jgi:hypothetical protein
MGNKKDLGTRLKPPGFRYASFLILLSPLSSAILFSGGWFHYNRAALWPQKLLYESVFGLSSDLAAIFGQFRYFSCHFQLPLTCFRALPRDIFIGGKENYTDYGTRCQGKSKHKYLESG